MTSQRGRRTTRRAVRNPDFEYGIPSSSEQDINVSSQNTVVSEQNDSDSSYHENTPTPPANASEENLAGDREEVVAVQEGEQSSSEENETDQSPRARWLRKWKRTDPGLCCVCLDEDATKDNVLVYCDGKECDVVVHQECYGITTLPKKEDPWYCDRCLALPSDAVRCVLCPNKNGAFRKIRASDEAGEPMVWVHILCAFWMPGMHIGSAADLRDIQVVNVDPKNWGKKCHVCNSEEGAAIHCDAGQCKNWVHATCAVAYGLTEYVDEENISDPYFIYCKQHGPNDHPRQNRIEKWIRMRDDFLADECSKRSELRNIQLRGGDPGQNLREIFEDAYAEYTSQREVRITDARRRIVQQASKHNGLIDAKEKAEKNVRDFRAKIPNVKIENTALKSYLEKANESILSLVPHMRNIQVEILEGSNYTKIETLMELMASKNNIFWSKEIKNAAKSIKVKQLNTSEMRSLNLKSVVSALARAAKEEKEKARQRGRRNGAKNRGRPKTPNKGKEKTVANQEEIPEGEEYDEQQTPKRTTRSRTVSVKGKEKFAEDEEDTQIGDLSNENSNKSQQLRKVPRLRIFSRELQQMTANVIEPATPKRKRAELPTQNQLPDITAAGSSKRKRVQENLSSASTNTTEAESSSSKKNTKRSKRKRVEDVPSEDTSNINEKARADVSNNNGQVSTSIPADEVAQSAPAKRQYKKSRKSANKEKKADEQTSAGISNDQTSSTIKVEQTSETIQAVQDDSPSPTSVKNKRPTKKVKKTKKPNETVGDATNTNDASKRAPKRTSTKSKIKNTSESKVPTKTKLRPIAPKTSEIANVLNVEEKSENSTFPVVLNRPKNEVTNTFDNNDHIEDEHISNDVVTTTLTHGDVSDVSTAAFDSSQSNVKVENNEESSSNTTNIRSGGVIGINNLLNPIEDTPSSTSTVYDFQSYFSGNENLYQTSSTPSNNVPIQNTGYGNITTPPFQRSYFLAESSSNQTSFRVENNTYPSSSYTTVSQVDNTYSSPYTAINKGNAANYTRPFGSVNQGGTNAFVASSYAPMNLNSPTMFTNSYSNANESRTSTTFTSLTDTGPVSTTNASSNLDVLLSAAKLVDKSPETTSYVVQKNNEAQGESMTEPSQIKSQTSDNVATFYGGANTNGQVYTNTTNPSEGVITPYQIGSVKNILSFTGPSTFASANTSAIAQDDSAIAETSSELSKENDTHNIETVIAQDEGTNEESVQDTANQEELAPEQSTIAKPRRKRGPGGIKKKAGRKPKAKLTEEEAAQSRAPIPQPNCTICRLVIPPANDQPSATYITPQRARESMLLKGRDKVNRMVRCGYCSKWYHLACMVPPRRTMPTGGYVWRCAECDHPSSSTSESPAEHSGGGEAPSVPTIPTKKWNLRSATR